MSVSSHTDTELVAQARAGSREAVAELFQRHWDDAWKAAFALTGSRTLAEDIAQDGFERAIRRLSDLNGGPFAGWLRRICVNRAIDVLRRERRLGPLDDETPAPAEWAGQSLSDRTLMRAVGSLDVERRVPVVLRYWLDYTPAEIAQTLQIPVGTVSSRLSRALADLRVRLEER